MNKLSLLALAVIAMTGSALAQDNASASGTGTVQVPVSITNERNLDFGDNMKRGAKSTISVNSGGAASFHVVGDAADKVAFTVDPIVTLYLDGEGQTLAGVQGDGGQVTTMQMAAHAKINTVDLPVFAVEILPAPDQLSIPGVNDGGAYPANSGIGQLYLFVGGDIWPSASQQRGSYRGTLNVAVDYSN